MPMGMVYKGLDGLVLVGYSSPITSQIQNMSGLTPIYFKANPSTYVALNLDRTMYDGEIATAVGGVTTEPPAGSTTFFLSQKAAVRSNALGRIVLGCKRAKKRRQVVLICDREKLATVATALKGKKIKLGLGAGVDWDINTVRGA